MGLTIKPVSRTISYSSSHKLYDSGSKVLFIESLEKQDELPTEYDTKLFNYLVDKLIIHKGKRIEIHLKDGEVISCTDPKKLDQKI